MSKPYIHAKAIILRKNGGSISAIAKKLSVSKSTVSVWCRDIALTNSQIATLVKKNSHRATQALLCASEIKRARRILETGLSIQYGKDDVGKLSKRDLYMVGLGLYWGEGYKKGSQELGFTNSDLSLIHFYITWLNKIYKIKNDDLILRVSINMQHKNRDRSILEYWSTQTNIPLTQFTKTSFIKTTSKKIYPNPETHFGTLRIKVRRGTSLRRRILGSISALTELQIL